MHIYLCLKDAVNQMRPDLKSSNSNVKVRQFEEHKYYSGKQALAALI
jgi:hypothetical protein